MCLIEKTKNDFIFYKSSFNLFCLIVVLSIASCKGDNKSPRSLVYQPNDTSNWPASFGFGRIATATEIGRLDIDISPDGRGLPAGSGTVGSGSIIYQIKCAFCHGSTGKEGPFNPLVGVMGDTTKAKTIGNYWPYSTTIFDYIRRAMPYNMPGSLTNGEVYDLTAYLLYKNQIIDSATGINSLNLPGIKMPAQKFFVNDDRHGGPEVR